MHDNKKDKSKDYLLGLHWAATTGNVGLVKFALDHGAPIDSVVNGFMPLQLACISDNNIAVVQYLIDRGAQVNAQRWSKKHSADKSQAVAGAIGSTALHVACANGCSKIVELLLRNDAKVDVKDKYGSRPLDIAAAKHHIEIVKLLETFGALQQHREASTAVAQYEDGRRSMDVIYSSNKKNQMASSAIDDRAERMRRPSLPSVFEGKSHSKRKITSPALDIPPLSTLPPTPLQRKNMTTTRLSLDQDRVGSSSIDIHRRPSRYNQLQQYQQQLKVPELASSKSSDDSIINTPPPPLPPLPSSFQKYNHYGESSSTTSSSYSITSQHSHNNNNKHDGYSYGVLNYEGDENYLTSLERRAYGLDDYPTRQSLDQVRPSRLSLDTYSDATSSSVPNHASSSSSSSNSMRPRLKRCSSDGGYLRATALRNAMAAKKSSHSPILNNEDIQQEDTTLPDISNMNLHHNNNNNIHHSNHMSAHDPYPINEPLPRRSIATDDRSLEALRQIEEKEMKKAWWSAFGGRKSMDVATFQRHHQHFDQHGNHHPIPRQSLDFRPSFDGLSSHWNNKTENPSGEGVDMNFEDDEYDYDSTSQQQRKPGFFSRWVGNWSKK
ncbi:hypothetical protein BJ944DRAFT_242975 [Cunninghamella echinulata]|nr:hypothetical protein BJ944DRAFT_242975 [Cunninghamella echinulata]